MTNYSVPFDFDGNRFLWVEFFSEKERNICTHEFESSKKWNYSLNSNFGHISFARLLPGNLVLIIRLLNDIEIREMDSKFTLKYSFKNIGDEVLAMDYYIQEKKQSFNQNKIENLKIISNNKDNKDKEMDNIKKEVKMNVESGDNNLEGLNVILVDIDGNINLVEALQPTKKKLNMYDVKDISTDVKNKQFFSMGYPYYVKASPELISVSTDHGLFVFKNQ